MIRQATLNDLDKIMEIYDNARDFMRKSGNSTQWINGYPSKALIEQDISLNQCYVYDQNGSISGVFMFFIGEDPTYKIIENGNWLNDETYGTIHRLAGDGTIQGLSTHTFNFCKDIVKNLRADTHHDNKIMQHLLEKNGFTKCGIIYTDDNSPRIAYHYCVKD